MTDKLLYCYLTYMLCFKITIIHMRISYCITRVKSISTTLISDDTWWIKPMATALFQPSAQFCIAKPDKCPKKLWRQ